MAQTSIGWTATQGPDGRWWPGYTFNILWGCEEYSPGCANCYAAAWAGRFGQQWGAQAPRRHMSDRYWAEPYKWNQKAEREGVRFKVFCSSMADVMEDHPDNNALRPRLWQVIRDTQNLDYLILTKRTQRILGCLPDDWGAGYANVWMGTTIESPRYREERTEALCQVPARLRFVSHEPALSALLYGDDYNNRVPDGLHWMIVGGESRQRKAARPFDLDGAIETVSQCRASGVPVFVKQLGDSPVYGGAPYPLSQRKGEDIEEFPLHLQVREFPVPRAQW